MTWWMLPSWCIRTRWPMATVWHSSCQRLHRDPGVTQVSQTNQCWNWTNGCNSSVNKVISAILLIVAFSIWFVCWQPVTPQSCHKVCKCPCKLYLPSTVPVLRVVGATPNKKFLRNLVFSIAFQSGLTSHGRVEYFLIMHPYNYMVRYLFQPVFMLQTVISTANDEPTQGRILSVPLQLGSVPSHVWVSATREATSQGLCALASEQN